MSYFKKLSKYIADLDYFGKALIVLSATSGGRSVISFTSVIGISVRIASASFSLIFSLATGIIKKVLKITRNKKKKHNKVVMPAKIKLNSIEVLISQIIIDLEITQLKKCQFDISNYQFKTIVNEEKQYKRLKENIRMMKNSDELNKEEGNTTKLWVNITKMRKF